MTDTDFLAARTEYWTRALTAIPSVTGTADEASFAERFAALLAESPAFAAHRAVWTVPVPGGRFPRSCVLGLVHGEGTRTVLLTGHFDTVETDGYGELKPLALDPDKLGPALVERIGTEPHDERSARALADLKTGDFLPGRGLLDMKAGLAAGLAVAEAFARQDQRRGNILFLAVPDEEGNSAGARHMANRLGAIAAERGLSIEAAINLDSIADDGDGREGRVVALGSVGKLLPSALVVGRATHASYSFRGFGAAALAGAIAAELEWAPELTERTDGELGAGPTLLGMKDSKTAYDVTTPAGVWMYWNVALHRRSPQQVLDAVAAAAERAAKRLSQELTRRAAEADADAAPGDVTVLAFEALANEVAARSEADAGGLADYARDLAETGLDLPEQCRLLTERAWGLSGRSGPAVVLGFASTPYLAVRLGSDEAGVRLEAAVREAAASISRDFDTSIGTISYFPGISDVSFLGQGDMATVPAIAANTPAWTSISGASPYAVAGIPTVNAGPWGRDYHTRLERMHTGYGFRVLPALLQDITRRVLEGE